ncbi:MAG TPA: amino acid ABC transporter permease [Burkholderiaceae bacterium]|nr:amino acid ABC transporter permease [Burkholderiaceae bacterium]
MPNHSRFFLLPFLARRFKDAQHSRIYQALFGTPVNALISVLLLWLLLLLLPGLFDWLVFNARIKAQSSQDCAAVAGACWAVIVKKHRLILFGLYPFDQQWRPLLASILLITLIVCSAMRRCWRPWLALAWLLTLAVVAVLMWGGVFGLTYVDNSRWGGLPLTLILSTAGVAFAFPLGVLLALGRRSNLPVLRGLSIAYIELIRGVPLISLLFMASVMLPLFLPAGFGIDKLLRAQIAIILFAAAYIAETVRGGLQTMPKGQYEGAFSLGLAYWPTMLFVILPQALRRVIGPLVNIFISIFKDTSLVVVIGLFDLTLAAKSAATDPDWQGFSIEIYLFIALIYFAFCFAMSRYSRSLENHLRY